MEWLRQWLRQRLWRSWWEYETRWAGQRPEALGGWLFAEATTWLLSVLKNGGRLARVGPTPPSRGDGSQQVQDGRTSNGGGERCRREGREPRHFVPEERWNETGNRLERKVAVWSCGSCE